MIDLSRFRLRDIVQVAYFLSNPQGLGHIHYNPAPLTEEELDEVDKRASTEKGASFDYVHGRAMKLQIRFEHEGKKGYFIRNDWYDHSPEAVTELVSILEKGISK